MRVGNIFDELPDTLAGEQLIELAAAAGVRIERVVSTGQASPPGFWYDQDDDEWVIVLRGCAGLEIEGRTGEVEMAVGDWIWIRARERHRIAWTSPDEPTVWLAVHFPGAGDGSP